MSINTIEKLVGTLAIGKPNATVEVTEIEGGHRITVTDPNGVQELDVMDGKDGERGIGIREIWQFHRSTEDGGGNAFNIVLEDGTEYSFIVNNGSKGEPGPQGEPGYTPVKGVDYFDGEQGPQGPQGEPGKPGPAGSDANVTATNIIEALGYTPADPEPFKASIQRELSTELMSYMKFDRTTGDPPVNSLLLLTENGGRQFIVPYLDGNYNLKPYIMPLASEDNRGAMSPEQYIKLASLSEGGGTDVDMSEYFVGTVAWDGNTNGKRTFDVDGYGTYYRLSSEVITMDDLANGITVKTSTGISELVATDFEHKTDYVIASDTVPGVVFVLEPDVVYMGSKIPDKGIFFLSSDSYGYVEKITIPSYTGTTLLKLKEKYLPETVAMISDVEAMIQEGLGVIENGTY